MSQPAKPGLSQKARKIAGIVLGCVVGIIVLASILLLTFLEPVAGRMLKELVTEKSDGLYTVDFENLKIDLLDRTIAFEQLHLLPDTVVHRQQHNDGVAPSLLLQLETPHLKISNINLMDALFHNKATIGTVSAKNPAITLIADELISKDASAKGDDGDSFLDFLDAIQIGKVEIQDASFRYLTFKQNLLLHEMSRVSLVLHELSIPPRSQQDALTQFHVDDVQLKVRDYTYNASDSLYQFQVGLLSYSLKQRNLLATDIMLLPNYGINAARRPEEAHQTLYKVEVSEVRIAALDLLKAYATKQLKISEVLLEKPNVNLSFHTNASAPTRGPDINDLHQQFSDYLTSVEIGEVRLTKGRMAVSEKIEEFFTVHELQGTEINLQNLILDSARLFSPNKHFFAEALLFSAESYTYQHPYNPHFIETGSMELSTQGNYFYVNALAIRGDKAKNDRLKQSNKAQPLVVSLNAPRLQFNNMNLLQAWQTGRLSVGTIDALKPTIEVQRDKSVAKAGTEGRLQETYTAVSGFLNSFVVNEINIQDASFKHLAGVNNLRRVQELEHLTLQITELEIDSAFVFSSSAESIPVKEAVVTAHNYTFRTPDGLYTFTLDRIQYSTRKQVLSARSVALAHNTAIHKQLKARNAAQPNLYTITASQLSVTGLDVIKAIETGELMMDQVILRQPDFAMFRDRTVSFNPQEQNAMDGLYSIVNPIKVASLQLQEGTFTYHEKRDTITRMQLLKHVSATVQGLNLGSARLNALNEALPMQEMSLTAHDYTYRSPDGIYTIKLDSLKYSSQQQELTARHIDLFSDKEANERLKRNNSEQANRNLFDVSADQFRVTGLDLIRAYETGQFKMTEMQLTKPEVAILQDQNVPSRFEDTNDREAGMDDSRALQQISETVESFRVEQLRVNDGNFSFNVLQDTVLTSHTTAHVSVTIDQLRTSSLETNDFTEMFQVDDIGVLVRNYSYLLPDSSYKLNVGEVRSSLRDQTLFLDDLHLLPLPDPGEFVKRLAYQDDRFEVEVPHIILRGMNQEALFNNQDFIIEKALIVNPDIDIYRDKNVEENQERQPPTLQQMLRQTDLYLQLDTVALEGGKLKYTELPLNGIQPGALEFDNVYLEALNVTNDSTLLSQNSIATVTGSTLLMGESELSVRFLFYLDHPEDLYTYEGTLQPMDFKALNPLFMNLIFVKIEDGHINKASFAVRATEHLTTGNLRFFYNDLELQLIDKEDPENPSFLRNAGSWLLNRFIIKSNNPAGRRDLREGNIEVERDYSKSVFNHMGKGMINGITSSLTTPFIEKIILKFVEL